MPEVDRVIGNAEKMHAEHLPRPEPRRQPARRRQRHHVGARDRARPDRRLRHAQRAPTSQVQNGCDHRCTFCIIPFGRGPSRSVPAGEVVAQVRRLVEAGYAEVVLTGVDITDYGADLPGEHDAGQARAARSCGRCRSCRACASPPSIRSRSTRTCIAAIAEEPRLMPHLHLSLQAGDDMILKRMKRRHSRADAMRFCAEARRLRPDIVFGADLIAGFPTETEAMFDNSLRLVDDCGLTFLHVFPFSPRPGTPAARMPQVARASDQGARRAAAGRRARPRSRAISKAGSAARSSVLMEREHLGRTPGVRRDGAGAPGAGRAAAAGPRHRVRRPSGCGRAPRPQVGTRERHLPPKSRGLMGLFRRAEAPRSACAAGASPRQSLPAAGAAASRCGDRAAGRAAEEAGLVPAPQGWADQDVRTPLRRHRRHLHQAEARRRYACRSWKIC